MNNPRPTGVTLLGFLGALGALIALFTAQRDMGDFDTARWIDANPLQAKIEQLYSYLDAGINLLACYFMLQAKNWARWLYLGWNAARVVAAIGLAIWLPGQETAAFLRFDLGLSVSFIILLIAPFLLFRAAGKEYFANSGKPWWRE